MLVIPGVDGVIRSVEVLVKGKVLIKTIEKLVPLEQWFSNFLESLPLGNAMIGHHYPLIPFPFSYVKLKEKILGCLVLVHFICKKIILL